jgi:two-component system osmolarity sensor histidine kinase EnvZ
MLDTFLKQTIAVLVATIFAALVISFATVSMFVVRPQIDRAAEITAHTLHALGKSLDRLDTLQRARLIETLTANSSLNVQVALERPAVQSQPDHFLGRYFKQALETRYQLPDGTAVASDSDGQLWVRINVAQQPLWLSATTASVSNPVQNLLLLAALAFAAALVAGIALQRRVSQPLKTLENHVRQFDDPKAHHPLSGSGVREIEAVSDAFNQMVNRLKLTEADRAVMLAGVSHDLRTPLTKLRLSLDMLHDADEELTASAKRQVDRIETMLVQFLEYARGFDAEAPVAVYLSALLERSVQASDYADNVRVDPTQDATVFVRQGALLRALGNLINNAMRYGKAPVRVSAHLEGEILTLEVLDCGPGMEPEEARVLTRPFARGNSARTGDGTGLGLAIVQQAALAHGGRLDFRNSELGFCAALVIPVQFSKKREVMGECSA